jgi:hypothetical protein
MHDTRITQSRLRTIILRLAGTVMLAAIATGCSDSPFEPPASNPPVSQPPVHAVVLGWQYRASSLADFAIGETYQLIAVATDEYGAPMQNRTITWASSKPGVASVSQNGLITMHAAGFAEITAAAGGRKATFEVRVLPAATTVGSFRMTTLDGQALPAQLNAWHGPGVSGYSNALGGTLVLRADWTFSQTVSVDVYRNGAFHYDFTWEDAGQFRIEGGELVFTSSASQRVVRGSWSSDALALNETMGGNASPQLFAYERI